MINVRVRGFVEEGEMVSAVANELGVSHDEAEKLYCELGGYSGNGPVSFDARWPNDDPFSVAVQEFMGANNIQSLDVGYRD